MVLDDNARPAHAAGQPALSRIAYLFERLLLPEATLWVQRLAKEGWATRDVGAQAVGKALRAVGFTAHCCCCCSCHPWRTALIALDLLLANHAYQAFLSAHPVETWLVVAVAVIAICTAADSLAPRHLMCFPWLRPKGRSRRCSVRSGCATAVSDDVSKSGHVSAAAAVKPSGNADEKAVVKRDMSEHLQGTTAGGQRAVEGQQPQWQDASGELFGGRVEEEVEAAWYEEDSASYGGDHAAPLPQVRGRVPDPRVVVPSRQPSSNSCNSSSGTAASSTSVPGSSGRGSGSAGYSSDGGEGERARASRGERACPCPCNCRCVCLAASKAPYTAPLDTDSVLQLYSTPCRCSPMCTLEFDSSAHTTTASNAEDGLGSVPSLAAVVAAGIAPGAWAQPNAVASLFARPSDQSSLCDHAPAAAVAVSPPSPQGNSGTASASPYTAAPALPPLQPPAAAPATPAAVGSVRVPLQGQPPAQSAVRSVVQLSDKPPWGFTTGRLGLGAVAPAAAAAAGFALPAGALPPSPLPSLGLVGGTRVRSLLVRKDRPSSPVGARGGGAAVADPGHVARLDGVATAAAAAVACSGGTLPRYVPVTRARMLSVKVHEPPLPFLEFAPTACERIQAYLRSTAATAATGAGGAGMGGGGGGVLASIGSLAIQGCVQVVSWVQTLSYGGGPGDARPSPGGGDGGGGGAMTNIECYKSYRVRPLRQQPHRDSSNTHGSTRTHSQVLEALPLLGPGLGPVDVQADGLVASFNASAAASASAAAAPGAAIVAVPAAIDTAAAAATAAAVPAASDIAIHDASCRSTSSCGGRKSSSSDAERSTMSLTLSRTSTAGLSDRWRAFCDQSLGQQQQQKQTEEQQQRPQERGVEEVVAGPPQRRGRSLDYGVGASVRHVGSTDLLITWAAPPCTAAIAAEQQERGQASQAAETRQDVPWATSVEEQQQQLEEDGRIGGTAGIGRGVGLRRSSSGPVLSVRELGGGIRAHEGALARRSEGRATAGEHGAAAAEAAKVAAGQADDGPAAEPVELLWVQPCVLVAPGWEEEEESKQLRDGDGEESSVAAAAPDGTQLIEVCLSAPADGSGDSDTFAVRLLLVSYDMHVVVDEHVQLRGGAVSVVTLAVAVPPGGVGALRLLVLAPAAAHDEPLTAAAGALGGGDRDGGARVLVHATAAVLCLPRAVAEEMHCVVQGAVAAAAEATAAVTAAADVAADAYGQQIVGFLDVDGGGGDGGGGAEGSGAGPAGWAESPLSMLWSSFLGPFCADFAFLLDVAARGGHGGKGWRPDSGGEGLQAPGSPLGGCLLGDPRAKAAAMGLTAVFEHLRSALEPLGAEATRSFLAELTTAAARAVLWGEQPLPPPPPPPPQQQQHEPYHSHHHHTLPTTASSTPDPVSAPLPQLPTPPHLQHQLCAWPTSSCTPTSDAAASHSPVASTPPGSSSTSPTTQPQTAPPSPPRRPQQQQHVAGDGSAPADAPPPQQRAQTPVSCATSSSFAAASCSTAAAVPRSKGAPELDSASFDAAYAAALLSDRRQLLLTPLQGFKPVAYHQHTQQHQQQQKPQSGRAKPGALDADSPDGSSSRGAAATAAAAPPPGLEERYERYTARAYRGLDLAAFALLVAMFAVVTWRKLRLAAAASTVPLLAVGGVKLPYNIVMLWVVASTVMLPYYLQVVNGRAYERCRERLHVFSQVINAVVYGIFASGILPMPSEMTFHWNHSHVLQRGLVRPIRRPVRFRTHVWLLVVEVLGVTPAFLSYSGWRATLSTTLTTYSLSVAVGYALDLAMRRVFLHSLLMAAGGARVGARGHGHVSRRGAGAQRAKQG